VSGFAPSIGASTPCGGGARLVRRSTVFNLEPNMLAEEARNRVTQLRLEADIERHLATARTGTRGIRRPSRPWHVARVAP
jgi:hypothetical protein